GSCAEGLGCMRLSVSSIVSFCSSAGGLLAPTLCAPTAEETKSRQRMENRILRVITLIRSAVGPLIFATQDAARGTPAADFDTQVDAEDSARQPPQRFVFERAV